MRIYKPRKDIRRNLDGKNAPRNERCTLYEAFIRSENGVGLRGLAGRRHGRTTWIFSYDVCCLSLTDYRLTETLMHQCGLRKKSNAKTRTALAESSSTCASTYIYINDAMMFIHLYLYDSDILKSTQYELVKSL
jgi:hypothetical protein